MNNHEELQDIFREIQFDDAPDHGHRDALEKDLLRALVKRPHERGGRRHRTVRLASAATITLAVVLGLMGALWNRLPAAYAIGQTIEAIRNVSVVHIFGRDWDDKQIEIWSRTNPETGLMDIWHVRHIDEGRVVVSTPQNTFSYDEGTNTVRIQDGPSVASIFCLSEFFAGMNSLAGRFDGRITYAKVVDPASQRELLELTMSAPRLEIRSLIDPDTKLPLSIDTVRGDRVGSCDTLKHATKIRYDDAPPEGLFDFTIPAGANVVVETLEDPLRDLPASVLRTCANYHLKTLEEVARPADIPINTQIYFVDDDFNLCKGGFAAIRNDSNDAWTGEVHAGNYDYPNMALFDAASGKKQRIRLVQHRQVSPGRFRLYWQLDPPLPPGETRYVIWWVCAPETLCKSANNSSCRLRLNNYFGGEGIESFLLITPEGMTVFDYSRPYLSRDVVDEYTVTTWQRHLPKQAVSNTVDLSLSHFGADYSSDYIERNRGRVLVEIPETFELANIAIAISERGLEDPYRVNKNGAYYQKVLDHFLPFQDHPLIAEPDLVRNFGYPFRDNSICCRFDGNRIVPGGLYSSMRRPDLFRKHLAQLEDFARVSGFREFYRENLPFYREQIELYRQKVPVRQMWTWLEDRFPARHDCYKVVFSPLVGGSHETCSFANQGFSETIMFVSGPGESKDTSNKVEEGLLARTVFTEIDHNYVNRVTDRYADRVDQALGDLDLWNHQENYRTVKMTFNEYMTWSVFLLYARDTYDADTFQQVNRHVVNQMVHSRKFVHFGQFNNRLLQLSTQGASDRSISDLYPAVLTWAEEEVAGHNTAGWLDASDWTIIGPFENTDGVGFETVYPPEKETDAFKEYEGKNEKVKWLKPKHRWIDGYVDLAALLGRVNWAVAYAATSVPSPEVRQVQLRIGSDDDVKAWLNGEQVLSRNVDRAAGPDQDVISVTLRKGQNQLLLKVCNRLYSWGFYARIVDPNRTRTRTDCD
jgi:hypothetical protein